jgi:hypothetical protein
MNRLNRYEFFNQNNVNTLFNTYTYIDNDNQVDIFKRFLTLTNNGIPALTDSMEFMYDNLGQVTELTQYSSPDGSNINSFSIQFSYDEKGRSNKIFRGSRTIDFFMMREEI